MNSASIQLPGYVRVISTRNAGQFTRLDFVIGEVDAATAAGALLDALIDESQLFVNDHRRDDSEGGVMFAKSGNRLRRKLGGHGYSSEWSLISEAEAKAEIELALKATKWGAESGAGHYEVPNIS
jgi:hypothetical protein